jgi:hypothetical protein
VAALYRRGATPDEFRKSIRMDKYKDFRQFPQFQATFEDNAATIYGQLQHRH